MLQVTDVSSLIFTFVYLKKQKKKWIQELEVEEYNFAAISILYCCHQEHKERETHVCLGTTIPRMLCIWGACLPMKEEREKNIFKGQRWHAVVLVAVQSHTHTHTIQSCQRRCHPQRHMGHAISSAADNGDAKKVSSPFLSLTLRLSTEIPQPVLEFGMWSHSSQIA